MNAQPILTAQCLLENRGTRRALVDLGGRVASFSTPAYLYFKNFLGLGSNLTAEESVTFLNTIAEINEQILQTTGCLFRRVYLSPPQNFKKNIEADGSFYDEWKVKYEPRGFFNERTQPPLAGAQSITDLAAYPWPDPLDPGRLAGLRERVESLKRKPGIALVAGHISAGIFQDCWNLRGMQNFLEDMVVAPHFAEYLLDKITEIHLGLWDVFLSLVGEYVCMVETADDLGSQKGLLISPKMYRRMIKPRHERLNRHIRSRTRAKILFHSCGAIMPLIGDLIEIGIQILNPIQPLPGLMDPEILSQRFGKDLIFHGGLDVQKLLLEGTPAQIREHVRHYYQTLGVERYIMAPTNSIQPGTPPENIMAAYACAKELIDCSKVY